MYLSNHANKERGARIAYITKTVGFGSVVAEIKRVDKKTNRKALWQLTSTGVIMIKSVDGLTIITTYIASINQATFLWRHATSHSTRLPDKLYQRILDNKPIMENQPC